MKKVLLMAVAVGTVLVGCVKNETTSGTFVSDSRIQFEAPLVGSITRAVPGEIGSASAYPPTELFNVWGWYHTGDYTTFGDTANGWANYMTDVSGNPLTVTNSGNSWVPAQDYYWPKTGKLTFAAYSPADAAGTLSHDATGLKIADFVVAAVGAQYDLMYSDRAYNRTESSNNYAGAAVNTYEGVDIVFHHALSSIVFVVGTDINYGTADIDFKIKKIELSNIVNKGSFDEKLVDATTDRTPKWTPSAEPGDKVAYVPFEGSFAVPEDGATYSEPSDAKDLLLLPQTFDDNATVTVTYTMETSASGEIEHQSVLKIKDYTTEWKPNKRYTYRIIFGLNKIYFAPVVEDWDDVTVSSDIEL